jgi:hypothetical protein
VPLGLLRPDHGGMQRVYFSRRRMELGIVLDCIRSIMIGTAQPKQAMKPLP